MIVSKLLKAKAVGVQATVKKEGSEYFVYSEKGKKLSKGYKTKEEADKRLKEIEYFKHAKAESQLEKGIKVEREHKDTYDWLKKVRDETGKWPSAEEFFKHISVDHNGEFERYYDALEFMEAMLKAEKKDKAEAKLTPREAGIQARAKIQAMKVNAETDKTAKQRGQAAQAAALIKKELSQKWPNVKFIVKSKTFSGGDDVRVGWTDYPREDEVEPILEKYEAGHFDGMTDMYEYKKKNSDLPQAKYVMISGHQISAGLAKKLAAIMNSYYSALQDKPIEIREKHSQYSDMPIWDTNEFNQEQYKAFGGSRPGFMIHKEFNSYANEAEVDAALAAIKPEPKLEVKPAPVVIPAKPEPEEEEENTSEFKQRQIAMKTDAIRKATINGWEIHENKDAPPSERFDVREPKSPSIFKKFSSYENAKKWCEKNKAEAMKKTATKESGRQVKFDDSFELMIEGQTYIFNYTAKYDFDSKKKDDFEHIEVWLPEDMSEKMFEAHEEEIQSVANKDAWNKYEARETAKEEAENKKIKASKIEVSGEFEKEIEGVNYEFEYKAMLDFGGDEKNLKDDIDVAKPDEMPTNIFDDNWENIIDAATKHAWEDYEKERNAAKTKNKVESSAAPQFQQLPMFDGDVPAQRVTTRLFKKTAAPEFNIGDKVKVVDIDGDEQVATIIEKKKKEKEGLFDNVMSRGDTEYVVETTDGEKLNIYSEKSMIKAGKVNALRQVYTPGDGEFIISSANKGQKFKVRIAGDAKVLAETDSYVEAQDWIRKNASDEARSKKMEVWYQNNDGIFSLIADFEWGARVYTANKKDKVNAVSELESVPELDIDELKNINFDAEPEETEAEAEPKPGDYIILEESGKTLVTKYQEGLVGRAKSDEDAEAIIRNDAGAHYRPTVWYLSNLGAYVKFEDFNWGEPNEDDAFDLAATAEDLYHDGKDSLVDYANEQGFYTFDAEQTHEFWLQQAETNADKVRELINEAD